MTSLTGGPVYRIAFTQVSGARWRSYYLDILAPGYTVDAEHYWPVAAAILESLWAPPFSSSTVLILPNVFCYLNGTAYAPAGWSANGSVGGPAAPDDLAVQVDLLSDSRRRQLNARMFLTGLPAADVSGGRLNAQGVDRWATWSHTMLVTLGNVFPEGEQSLYLIELELGPPPFYPVVGINGEVVKWIRVARQLEKAPP